MYLSRSCLSHFWLSGKPGAREEDSCVVKSSACAGRREAAVGAAYSEQRVISVPVKVASVFVRERQVLRTRTLSVPSGATCALYRADLCCAVQAHQRTLPQRHEMWVFNDTIPRASIARSDFEGFFRSYRLFGTPFRNLRIGLALRREGRLHVGDRARCCAYSIAEPTQRV